MELFVWRYVVPDPVHYFDAEPYYVLEKCIDSYSSLTWCERFQKPGNFELHLRADTNLLRYLQQSRLLITRADTDRAMIPDRVVLTTSTENGNYLKISGMSAEGVMRRRIIPQKMSFMASAYPDAAHVLNYLIQENIGGWWYYHRDSSHGPNTWGAHMWVNVIQKGTDDAGIPAAIDLQPYGQNLGTVIEQVCTARGMGFRLPFDPDTGNLLYEFFIGKDRTISQSENAPVIFSPQFNNLSETDYIYDRSAVATVALAGGEGDGANRKEGSRQRWSREYFGVGMNARSIFVDAKGLSSNTTGINGNAVKYQELLNSTAYDALHNANEMHDFSGKVLPGGQFRYRTDYFLGDTVSVQNDYGINGSAVVSEVTEIVDESGYQVVPTLSEWKAGA